MAKSSISSTNKTTFMGNLFYNTNFTYALITKIRWRRKKKVETPKITYKEIKNKFVSSKLEIEYQVNEEEGKLIYQDNTLYSSQTSNLNEEYLNPSKLINLLDENEYILKVKDEGNVYIYDINETKIEVTTKEDKITKVTIVGATDTYNITYKYE